MNGLIVAARRVIVVARTLHESTQIIQCNASVDLSERALDDVLEVSGAQRTTAIQRQQMTPSFRSEAAAFVRTEDSKIQGMKRLLA